MVQTILVLLAGKGMEVPPFENDVECWSTIVLEYWSTGVLEYWSIGVLEYCKLNIKNSKF
jgi:hypothetical protein